MQKQASLQSVVGPDGRRLTINDLPPPETRRWVTRRKAEVIAAVRGGLITMDDACKKWSLTEEELASWQRLFDRGGLKDLRATKIRDIRADERRHAAQRRPN